MVSKGVDLIFIFDRNFRYAKFEENKVLFSHIFELFKILTFGGGFSIFKLNSRLALNVIYYFKKFVRFREKFPKQNFCKKLLLIF